MSCPAKKPVYPTKKAAARHGGITYGSGKHVERKVKRGYISYKKPKKK